MKESQRTLSTETKYLIAIGGPTAVGKTAVSIQLAQKFNCPILSADSRQVYQEMTLGTAKPSAEERNLVKHYLVDHISIHNHYSVGTYEAEAIPLIEQLHTRHNVVILCGGTGLYHKAIIDGLDEFPDVPPSITSKYTTIFEEAGLVPLQVELQQRDPKYYENVDLDNARRLIRALSVIEASGSPFSSFIGQKAVKRSFTPIQVALTMDREKLYQRIGDRVDQMISNGLLEEVKSLQTYANLKSLQTVGYQELFKYFNNEISYSEAVELIKRNSRRYAKRQLTWFRNQGQWKLFDHGNYDELEAYIVNILNS